MNFILSRGSLALGLRSPFAYLLVSFAVVLPCLHNRLARCSDRPESLRSVSSVPQNERPHPHCRSARGSRRLPLLYATFPHADSRFRPSENTGEPPRIARNRLRTSGLPGSYVARWAFRDEGSLHGRPKTAATLLPAMQNCTEVAVENVRCGQGDGAMAATRGPGVDEGSRRVPYDGVSTERRRRDDRERDAGASAALPGAGCEQGRDRAAGWREPADGVPLDCIGSGWTGSWMTRRSGTDRGDRARRSSIGTDNVCPEVFTQARGCFAPRHFGCRDWFPLRQSGCPSPRFCFRCSGELLGSPAASSRPPASQGLPPPPSLRRTSPSGCPSVTSPWLSPSPSSSGSSALGQGTEDPPTIAIGQVRTRE